MYRVTLRQENNKVVYTVISSLIVLTLFSVACSSADPEIMQVDLRIVASLDDASQQVRERLSVFVDVHDPDGVEDVAWVVAEFPDDGVGWRLEDERMAYHQRDGEHWFGAAGLSVPGLDRLPRGAVRVFAGDLSGRSAEREIRIPVTTPRPEPDEFPRFERGGRVVLAPRAGRHVIDTGDRVLELVPPDNEAISDIVLVDDDRAELEGATFTIVAEVSSYLWLESGPWSLEDS